MTTDQRLEQLERQNAKMKVAVAGMAVVLAVVLLAGAGQDKDKPKVLDEVRAKKLVLIDAKGIPRCELADVNEGPKLRFLGENGKERVVLGAIGNFYGAWLHDREGRKRCDLMLNPSGEPNLVFADGSSKGGMNLKLSRGRFRAMLRSRKNKVRFLFSVDDDDFGSAMLSVADTKGEIRAYFELGEDGQPRLEFYDKAGNPIFKAPK